MKLTHKKVSPNKQEPALWPEQDLGAVAVCRWQLTVDPAHSAMRHQICVAKVVRFDAM